jgi:molecular chaperone DnaK
VARGAIPAGGSTGPAATSGANTPVDELCTDEIKNNRRWVCLTSAVLANGTLTIKYQVEYAGSIPDIHNGFHVHIYGGDGKNPPDYLMGTQAPKSQQGKYRYYWVDRDPAVLHTNDGLYTSAIGNYPKVCARMAVAGHGLVRDNKGGYKTGNCVPITRS